MLSRSTKIMEKSLKAMACVILLQSCLSLTAAFAQFAQPLGGNNSGFGDATTTQPNTLPAESPAPPIGSGNGDNPAEIQGDVGTPPVETNPGYDTTTGNIFQSQPSHDPTIVYIFHQQQGNRGLKMDRTLTPSTLDANTISQINGLLGINMLDGEPVINVIATDAQLAQLDTILAPYPVATIDAQGKQVITQDLPAPGMPAEVSAWTNYVPTLPTVRTFCRYLVILGVVAATIWMSLAAYGMILGTPYAGSRVIGTAFGLMLLLSAYTIWKIVEMNTYNAIPSNFINDVNSSRPNAGDASQAYMQPPGLPPVAPPGIPQFPPGRSGTPVDPLEGKDGS